MPTPLSKKCVVIDRAIGPGSSASMRRNANGVSLRGRDVVGVSLRGRDVVGVSPRGRDVVAIDAHFLTPFNPV
jgi:hypothetical protein